MHKRAGWAGEKVCSASPATNSDECIRRACKDMTRCDPASGKSSSAVDQVAASSATTSIGERANGYTSDKDRTHNRLEFVTFSLRGILVRAMAAFELTQPGQLGGAKEVSDVDVLIQTFNEEENLPHTLASLRGWVRRVFIVDSGSTDRTIAIAKEFGAVVVHHDWEGYAGQKNWALDNLPFESNWILILDADESVSPELREEIEGIVSRQPDRIHEAGFYLNRVFIFMGRQI